MKSLPCQKDWYFLAESDGSLMTTCSLIAMTDTFLTLLPDNTEGREQQLVRVKPVVLAVSWPKLFLEFKKQNNTSHTPFMKPQVYLGQCGVHPISREDTRYLPTFQNLHQEKTQIKSNHWWNLITEKPKDRNNNFPLVIPLNAIKHCVISNTQLIIPPHIWSMCGRNILL